MPMRRFLLTCVCAVALCAPATIASAQESVRVRSGEHGDYGRVVFDWKSATPYSITPSGDSLDIVFQKSAEMDASGVNITGKRNIKGVEKLSADGENLKVRINIPDGSTYRHFLIGDRVVVDVYGKTGADADKADQAADKPAGKIEETKDKIEETKEIEETKD